MDSFECKISDLIEKQEEKIEVSKELLQIEPENSSSENKQGYKDETTVYNINITNIKKIIIILVVYLLLNSEIMSNVIINNFSFMESQSGGLNLYGLLFTFSILTLVYFISS